MQSAARSSGGGPQNDWANMGAGTRPSAAGSTPHVLARLPDLRAPARPAAQPRPQPEPQRTSRPTPPPPPADFVAPRFDMPAPRVNIAAERAVAEQMTATVEMLAESRSEFFDPQGLASLDQVWQESRNWLSKHSKGVLIVLALVASHGALLFWRHAPAEHASHPRALEPLGDFADSKSTELQPADSQAAESQPVEADALHPVPMVTEAPQVDRLPPSEVATVPESATNPTMDEPHLALPRPRPDPISMLTPPQPAIPGESEPQPTLAAVARRERLDMKAVDTSSSIQPKMEAGSPAAPTVPSVDDANESPGISTDKRDVPPWESWPQKADQPAISPATEAAALAAPANAEPVAPTATPQPGSEPRMASMSANRPSSRATSTDRPKSVAKLKGSIGKPVAEPADGEIRKSLY